MSLNIKDGYQGIPPFDAILLNQQSTVGIFGEFNNLSRQKNSNGARKGLTEVNDDLLKKVRVVRVLLYQYWRLRRSLFIKLMKYVPLILGLRNYISKSGTNWENFDFLFHSQMV